MSVVISIISEYNPFHNGHKYQIDKIREKYADAVIVSIMSGNTVQRGDFAFIDKYKRAESAVKCGVDLVVELPFPYSSSNAEVFAKAGVKIASLIHSNYICFGCTQDDISYLKKVANVIDSEEMNKELRSELDNKNQSYLNSKTNALKKLGYDLPTDPNDILGIEYIRAIEKIDNSIIPIGIKREGSSHDSNIDSSMLSGHRIREIFYDTKELKSIPSEALSVFSEETSKGHFLDIETSKDFIYRSLLMKKPELIDSTYDAAFGIGYHLLKSLKQANDYNEFFDNLSLKNMTNSRLKRTLLYSIFGVHEIDENLSFVSLLGANTKGCNYLRECHDLKIISNYSNTKILDERENKIYEKNKQVDEIFNSLLSKTISPSKAYMQSPFIL